MPVHTSNPARHVCVIGAGIAGLTAADALLQRGHRVTVLDAQGVAAGASGGNGAQLSYAYVQPLADPALWAQLPKLLWARESALRWRPQWDVQQWRWMLAFLAACNRQRSEASTAALLTLAARSRAAFEALRAREPMDCDFSAPGKLVLLRTPAALAAARQQVALQQRLGGPAQEVLNAAQAQALEPALQADPLPLAGAVHTPSECAADCERVCQALARRLLRDGAELRVGQAVTGFAGNAERLTHALLDRGEAVAADAFVLSAGHASVPLARGLGLYLPVYPLKGYSITLALDGPGAAPQLSVTDTQRKLVYARLGQRLRVAGMVELCGADLDIDPARIASLQRATLQTFPGCSVHPDIAPWTGLRPATPTGLPLVGRAPGGPHNLWLHTGHGALGFTLSFGTAQALAEAL